MNNQFYKIYTLKRIYVKTYASVANECHSKTQPSLLATGKFARKNIFLFGKLQFSK
jgi:hypothetical protein